MPLRFDALWNQHAGSTGTPDDDQPCRDARGRVPERIKNQCAVRLGLALEGAGYSLRAFRGERCWYGHGHVLRAEELATWLSEQGPPFGAPEPLSPGEGAKLTGRKGVVFVRNFWGTPTRYFPNGQGDHIDVWNGSRMGLGQTSWFGSADAIWFWPISN